MKGKLEISLLKRKINKIFWFVYVILLS